MNDSGPAKFDLVANAQDSLVHAVKHLTRREGNREPGDLKRAVRDAVHAVELLLKEGLGRVHPSLVWMRVDDYPKDAANTMSCSGHTWGPLQGPQAQRLQAATSEL
jgi:hypothetical protein